MKRQHISMLALGLFLSASAANALTVALESATPGGDYANVIGTGPNITTPDPLPSDDEVQLVGDLLLNCVGGDCSDASGLRDPADAFFFTIGLDQELRDVLISVRDIGRPNGDPSTGSMSAVTFDLMVSGPGVSLDTDFTGAQTELGVFAPGTVLGPGTYSVFFGAQGSTADFLGGVGWQIDGFVANTAAPVPLPASGVILLGGVGALMLARRKRG